MKTFTTIIAFLISATLAAPASPANGILQEASAKGGNDPLTGDPIKGSTSSTTNLNGQTGALNKSRINQIRIGLSN
ncbi:hypothetical protein CONCODRAFT_13990 [Conidiobolus coronatus NRRL 28638]|uniref:Uncharacterized protein n=1 Tax=Conidiobolus coronatus (strain ATCC 28846 / CBS 209.66 / NRRL 28638) TaxID=796925 RepID=A0A137NPU2_CONC2|nr:hypothetical protein CONCODRAFT_13990 [Conidiobolus coronatus NRRL 28638]|eukprot:KXN64751.1 hypothetical protein CONCODRAFT_13990 [Conidiobolus coronatus NRRL 28638]